MSTFLEFVQNAGLLARDVMPDGRWHRVPTVDHPKKCNGAWKWLGRIGWCQNHAVHSSPLEWRDNQSEMPKIDFAAIAKRQVVEREKQAAARQKARVFYSQCLPLRNGHPYLETHGLEMSGCLGLKVDSAGWLVIPAWRGASLASVQRISPEGEKRFWPGAPISGANYRIERAATLNVLCEGLATGLAVFAAVRRARVIVAFDAGNLARVTLPKPGLAVVAADNDQETAERIGHNPGIRAAQEAACELCGKGCEKSNCGIAYPSGIAGTDWADYRMERASGGTAKVQRQVDGEISAALLRSAIFLGQ